MIYVYSVFVALFSINYQMLLDSNRPAHFMCSLVLAYALRRLECSRIAVISIVFSIGLAKEMQDPVFDWLDIVANCLGILVGML